MVGFVVVHILLSTFHFIRNFNNLFITERGFKMHHEKHRDIVCPSSSNRTTKVKQIHYTAIRTIKNGHGILHKDDGDSSQEQWVVCLL
jgi:hypothetical protein